MSYSKHVRLCLFGGALFGVGLRDQRETNHVRGSPILRHTDLAFAEKLPGGFRGAGAARQPQRRCLGGGPR